MTNETSQKRKEMESEGGFPLQAKLLLTVIIAGVMALVLKVVGIL